MKSKFLQTCLVASLAIDVVREGRGWDPTTVTHAAKAGQSVHIAIFDLTTVFRNGLNIRDVTPSTTVTLSNSALARYATYRPATAWSKVVPGVSVTPVCRYRDTVSNVPGTEAPVVVAD